MSQPTPTVPGRLWWELVGVTVLAATGAIAGFVALSGRWTVTHGGVWLTVTGLVAVAELWLLHRWLNHNRSGDAAHPRPSLGIANGLTILRGLLLASVAGFLPLARPSGAWLWVPAALYAVAVVLDFLDGVVARRLDEVTVLGRRLDEAMDTTGLLVAPTLAVLYGQLPVWYLVVPLAKPLYLGSLWAWRRVFGEEPARLPASTTRRYLAAVQMVVTAVALAPATAPPATTALAAAAAVPFVLLFVRDWLVTVDPV